MVYGPLGGGIFFILDARVICYYFFLPFIPHRNWWLGGGAPKALGIGRTVLLLIRESPGDYRSVLRKLLYLLKRVTSMSGVLAQGLPLR